MQLTRPPRDPRDHCTNRLLAALAPESLAYLEPHLEIVNLQRGQVLFETDEIIRYTYFPHDAVVVLVAVMTNGTSAEMSIAGREGVIGLVTTATTPYAFGRYVVQTPGTASRIGIEQMQKAISAHRNIRDVIQRFSEAITARVLQNVACNAVHQVDERCCRWILSTHDRVGRDTLSLSHELLAEMLGVQRSTVSAIMRTLQTAGLIEQGRGWITVKDRAGLERASCECYGRVRQTFERLLPLTYTKS
ncbi:Crp/Fnr family transcriptional regulator [Microvirga sp. KLBC 81]|uniref:Crp/Fnr family transcriptional regulator n=1 Tax=Microvirga sp. KLBC 81 TaxID=1862707 RepID=UPI000D50C104|nr:Crp/Fnr family transcriptional regulator [Microvirga sp. KLBC 81]PVE21305.1 Crp/Fnr family transcriptional regulator [Microvirga sp. KLBC 81]